MSELQQPRAATERKRVCGACRARRKRCSGEQPTCLSCRLRNDRCSYGPVSVSADSAVTASWYTAAAGYQYFGGHAASNGGAAGLMALSSMPWQPWNPSPFFPPPAVVGDDMMIDPTTTISPPAAFNLHSMPASHAGSGQGPIMWDENSDLHDWSMPCKGRHHLRAEQVVPLEHSGPRTEPMSSPPSSHSAAREDVVMLPSRHECTKLFDVYFKLIHPFLPLLHERTLYHLLDLACLQSPSHQLSASLDSATRMSRALMFAVLSLAINERADQHSRELGTIWYHEAKRLYACTDHVPGAPIQTLQTAVCIIQQAIISVDSSTIWLVIGRAWKQIVALGYHRVDRKQASRLPGAPGIPQDCLQRESIRRIVWTLYILDRTTCLPVGMDFTIDDSQLGVDLPLSNSAFQSLTPASGAQEGKNVSFTPNLSRLMSLVRESLSSGPTKECNAMIYLILNVMMISRIAIFSRLEEQDCADTQAALDNLETDLFAIRISLPRSITSMSVATPEDLAAAVWINILLCLNKIFLIYCRMEPTATTRRGSDVSEHDWSQCVAAAREMVRTTRQAVNNSIDSLLNPYVASAIFLCARVLVVDHVLNSSGSVHGSPPASGPSPAARSDPNTTSRNHSSPSWRDIEAIMLVYDRLEELFEPIGKKFKNGLRFHLDQDGATLRRIKDTGGIKDLLTQCHSWRTDAL